MKPWLRSGFGSGTLHAWAVEWWDHERREWRQQWLDYPFRLFRTRREAREYIEERMGYLRTREDLKAAPFHWRMPRAVKVIVTSVRDVG